MDPTLSSVTEFWVFEGEYSEEYLRRCVRLFPKLNTLGVVFNTDDAADEYSLLPLNHFENLSRSIPHVEFFDHHWFESEKMMLTLYEILDMHLTRVL